MKRSSSIRIPFLRRSFPLSVIIGALLVILVVTASSYWMSSGARKATDEAVEKVSDFYLEELAGRRSQVVSRFFENRAGQMQRAVNLLNPNILASQETLRKYIGNVRDIHGLNLFALVDEDNVVYTEHTTYMGGSRYAFLDGLQPGGMTITTMATYGAGKQICLAIPVENVSFLGKKLKACFIEIDMQDIVSMLAFNIEENGTHFSLYYENGANLTGLDFGPIGKETNLLREMRKYLSEEQWQSLNDHFVEEVAGEVRFTLGNRKEILYYSPIPETDWMITVMLPESLISDQVSGIRNKTITRSLIQIAVTVVALMIFFSLLAWQEKKKSKALLARERKIAVRDSLTGVGNQYAYSEKEATVDAELQSGSAAPYALVVCDLNGLKHVNDTKGHAEGDQLIRDACRMICVLYDHSPVYRIGGDEFAVFLRGSDYERREEILSELNTTVDQNRKNGGVVIAAGMAEYEAGDQQLRDTFRRADKRMYERKSQLKA